MRPFLALTLVTFLVISGCAVQDRRSDQPALAFAGTTLDGNSFVGASLSGRPAVLWFWAPWCPTCLAQSRHLSRLARQYDGRVEVIGVAGLATEDFIEDLAGQIGDVTHLVDVEGDIWKHFGVQAQSTFAVIDARGRVRAEGFLEVSELEDLVAGLVEER